MDVHRVKRIAQLVGHARGEHDHGVEPFAFDEVAGGALLFRDVAENDGELALGAAFAVGCQWHDIKADVPALGIGDFDFAGERAGGSEAAGGAGR